jgi:hypothetical protein
MGAISVREGLWSLVKPTAEEKDKLIQDKMACARAEIILRVENNELVHMISPNPMEIWLTLQACSPNSWFFYLPFPCRKFLMAKKSDFQTIQAWIGQIQGLAFGMEHAKIAVIDQDNVIINFDSMSPQNLHSRSCHCLLTQ